MSVYYLAHPLTPDDRFTYEQNMAHVLEMVRFFLDNDVHVIAPYHTHCLVLDDQNEKHRELGLEIDVRVVKSLKRIILVGHKQSRGMTIEREACESIRGTVHDFVGATRAEIKNFLTAGWLAEWTV